MKQKYCSVCGAEMIRVPRPAEKLKVYHYDGSGLFSEPLGVKYNPKTGYRQIGIEVMCLNKKWYNFHDSYVDENSLQDTDLQEFN